MKRSTFKVRARRILERNGGSARLVSVFVLLTRLLLWSAVALLSLTALRRSAELEAFDYLGVISLSLTVLGIILCINMLVYLRFIADRWFIMNSSEMRFFDLFVPPRLRLLLKLIALSVIKLSFSTAVFCVYELPCAAAALVLRYLLTSGSVKISLLVPTAVLIAVLFAGGFFFFFAEIQRFAMINYITAVHPEIKPSKAIRLSFESVRDKRFFLAVFKLSFLGWFSLCPLALPILFVAPYYSQSVAETAKPSLKASSSVLTD